MYKDTINFCASCISCAKHKFGPQSKKAPLETFPEVSGVPFQNISIDLVGPFVQTERGNRWLLTCICLYTRFPEAICLPDIKAETVARASTDYVFCRYGIPKTLLSDNGSQFISLVFKNVCESLGIRHIFTTIYHPQSNECLEKFHFSFKTAISHFVSKSTNDWDRYVNLVLYGLRSSPSKSTGESPYYLLFLRDPILPMEVLTEPRLYHNFAHDDYAAEMRIRMHDAFNIVRKTLKESTERRALQYNKTSIPVKFKVGQKVFVKKEAKPIGLGRKLREKYEGPYRIIEQLSPTTFRIEALYGRKSQITHCNRFKIAKGSEELETPFEELAISEESDIENSEEYLQNDDKEPQLIDDSDLSRVISPILSSPESETPPTTRQSAETPLSLPCSSPALVTRYPQRIRKTPDRFRP